MRRLLPPILCVCVVLGSSAWLGRGPEKDDVLLRALKAELTRSLEGLRGKSKAPLYYLGYGASETRTYDAQAALGALETETARVYRGVDVDVRLGSHALDNTHQLKGEGGDYTPAHGRYSELPVDDDEDALRAELWLRTDRAFKDAENRYTRVLTNKAVTASEEDASADFSREEPSRHYGPVEPPSFEPAEWRARLVRISAQAKPYPFLLEADAGLSVRTENRYLVTSEGSEVVTGNRFVRLSYSMKARTDDGMDLFRFQSYDGERFADLPDETTVVADLKRSAGELEALLRAPLVEPFTGPAIFRGRAAAVFFHEILGHRLEGHRQKLEDEGQTFKKKLGEPVTAEFLSVQDDPTLERFRGTFLRGFYRFDDEAVPARRVTLVEDGVLKGFLLSRSPIEGFPRSNGHGRRSASNEVVARMGNLVVSASRAVPYARLRERLLEEIRRQGKPYGLIFDDISGGYTNTSRSDAQSFKVEPLLVFRVFPDGRPDEPVRGVDIVGTPQASFLKIVAAADDPEIFNGTCGAESGWVPVAAVSPSLLLSEIEVEKKAKSSEKPPVLPPPHHDRTGGPGR